MARDFDGIDDNINVGDLAIEGLTNFAFTCWFNLISAGEFKGFFSKTDGTNRIDVASAGASVGSDATELFLGLGTQNDFGNTVALDVATANTWHHMLVWYDGSQGSNATRLVLYTEGVQRALSFFGTIPATTPSIGSANTLLGGSITGSMAEVAIWTGLPGGLTAAQAATILAQGYSPGHLRRNGLHYWPLIGRHSPEIDLWGGQAGTVTGAVAAPHSRIILPWQRKRGFLVPPTPPETLFAQACL